MVWRASGQLSMGRLAGRRVRIHPGARMRVHPQLYKN
jgi:hypothetical protein